uniref:alpha/beta hydrolase n=1 Tax=Sulfurimonas sp. TaxID=2022749 RepID=UPI00262670E7
VAPPSLDCTIEELSEFFPAKLPTTLNAANALLITSTNDPYLTQDEAQNLQKKLAVKMEVLENAGHINANSDFGEWKWMLQELKKELNS